MASRSLGTLTIDLIARIAGFTAGMDQAARIAEQRARTIERAIGKTVTAFALLGGAAATALTAVGKSVINQADQFLKLSQSTGVSVEALSELNYAAKLSGIGTEELTAALARLSRVTFEAAQGSKAQVDTFRMLGISARDVNGALKPTEDLLVDIAERFKDMPDGIAKAALAQELFGRSGARLIPLLNQGAAGIERLRKEAEALGVTINTEAAIAAEEFNDNLTKLQTAAFGAINRGLQPLLPVMKEFSDEAVDAAKKTNELADSGNRVTGFFKILAVSAVGAFAALKALGTVIGGIGATISLLYEGIKPIDFLTGAFKEKFETNAKLAGVALRESIKDATAEMTNDFERMGKIWNASIDDMKGKAAELADQDPIVIQVEYERAYKNLPSPRRAPESLDAELLENTRFDQLGTQAMDSLVATTEDGLKQTTQAFEIATSEWSVFAKEAARNMQDSLADFFFDPFKDGIEGMVQGFADALRRMVAEAAASKLLESLLPLFGGLFGGTGGAGNFPSSGGRATGGPVLAGQSYLIGERGPEILSMGRDAYVNPITQGAMQPAGVVVNVINPPTPPRVEESQNEDGTRQLNIFFAKMQNQAVADGSLDASMAGRYGLRPVRGGRR